MARECERCGEKATQDLLCSTELLEDKTKFLKKGHRFNSLALTDLCDRCSEVFFKNAKDFLTEYK